MGLDPAFSLLMLFKLLIFEVIITGKQKFTINLAQETLLYIKWIKKRKIVELAIEMEKL